MPDTSTNSNNPTKAVQQVMVSANVSTSAKSSDTKKVKPTKTPATPSDGLAVVGLFVVVGIFSSYFPVYSHTPSLQGICQFIAYVCYSIGFLGGCFELGKLSKSQFWDSFGIGIIFAFICFGVNWLADLTNHISVLPLIIRIVMVLPLAIAAYGVVRGILYIAIKNDASQQAQSNSSQSASMVPRERMKPEQIAGIIIAVLSVVTALITALPSLIPLIKQLLHLP